MLFFFFNPLFPLCPSVYFLHISCNVSEDTMCPTSTPHSLTHFRMGIQKAKKVSNLLSTVNWN